MSIRQAPPVMTAMAVSTECTICRGQNPNLKYVDFDAAADRGFYGEDSATRVPFDDVVICEVCVKNGAEIIGMVDGDVLKAENLSLEERLDTAERLRKQAQNYADRLEDAFENRDVPIRVDHRKKPRNVKEPV